MLPIMRSATIADRRDSTPARNAITKADGKQFADPGDADMGNRRRRNPTGSTPNCESIVSTGKGKTAAAADAAAIISSEPGSPAPERRTLATPAIANTPIARAMGFTGSRATPKCRHRLHQVGGHDMIERQSKQVFQLDDRDNYCDADRETLDHRLRHNAMKRPVANQPADDKDSRPRHPHRREQKAI